MEKDGKEEGKKKTNQKIRVGGLVGVGGVLVIGGLLMVANFAINRRRNKTRDSNKNPTSTDPKATEEANNNGTCIRKKNEDEDQRGQRLDFLIQTSSPMTLNSSSCKGHVDMNEDGISTTSLISQEQKLATEIDDLRVSESILLDAQEQEIIKLRDDFDALKDGMVLPDSQEQEINKSSDDFDALEDEMYGTEKPILIETTEEVENNKEISTTDHDSEMCSVEDKKEVEENSIERGNAGSDDTEDSSLKSNTDNIWPVEMTEETRPELEEAGQSDGCREEHNFSIKRRRNKTRDSNKNLTSTNSKASQEANNNGTCVKKKNEDQDQESQGLHFLLQTSSPLMTLSSSSCEGHMDRDGDGSSTTRVVSQEQELATEIDDLRVSESVLPDAQEQEIIKLRDDFDALKDGMVLPDSQEQEINKSSDDFDALEDEMYGTEKPILIETTEEVENNKEISTTDHDSEMCSVEDKKEVEENSIERGNAGSDDTEDSSLESNTDNIWPVEMTEETRPELEEAGQSNGCRVEHNFSIKRRRNKTRDSIKNLTSTNSKASQEANNNGTCVKKKNEDQDQESQGLHFLLQTSSPLMTLSSSSCESHIDRDGDGSSTTRVVSQEQKLMTEIDGLRVPEIVLSDAQEQQIIKLRDDFDALKDGMVLLDSQEQKINKSTDDFDALEDEMYGIEKPIPRETIKEVENNKEIFAINHDSEMNSIEDKKEVEENFEEKEIAGSDSDDIGDFSLESNTNDIWPVEMTEETMPELEEVPQSDRCREEDKEMQTKKDTQLYNDTTIANTTIDKQISTLSAWILSMLVLVLFFLWIYPVPRKVLSAVLSLFS